MVGGHRSSAAQRFLLALASVGAALLASPPARSAEAPPATRPVIHLGSDGLRHPHTVASIRYSRDGARLITACWDRSARIWDVATGAELVRFAGHADAVSSVVLRADGKVAASGGMGRQMFFWDAVTGRQLARLDNQENTVISMDATPDGRLLVTSSVKAVRIWDFQALRELHVFKDADLDVGQVAISPDGRHAAAAGRAGVYIWDAASGQRLHLLKPPKGAGGLAFGLDPDAPADAPRYVLASSSSEPVIRLWDPASGRELRTIATEGSAGRGLAFSPDGKTLARSENGRIRLFDLADSRAARGGAAGRGREVATFEIEGDPNVWVMSLAFSPDGRTLASSGTEKAVRLWDLSRRAERETFDGHHNTVIRAFFGPGGREVLSAGEDGFLYRWDAATGRRLGRALAHAGGVLDAGASRDGKALVTIGKGGGLRLWDGVTGEPQRTIDAPGGLRALAVSDDGALAAVASAEAKAILLYDLATGRERRRIVQQGFTDGGQSLAFSAGAGLLASGTGDRRSNMLLLWDVATGLEARPIPREPGVWLRDRSIAFSPDGATLAIAAGETIDLIDAATGRPRFRLEGGGEAGACLAFSPDGRVLAAGGGPSKPTLRLWELPSGRLIDSLAGSRAWLTCVSFSPDGTRLVAGTEVGTALVFDVGRRAAPATAVEPATRPATVTDPELDRLWTRLGAADPADAYRAIAALVAAEERAAPFLAARLAPVPPADPARVRALIRDLASERFVARERAMEALADLGEAAAPALQEALRDKASPEGHERLKLLLARLERPAAESPDALRHPRAVEALGLMRTPAAADALRSLASGPPHRPATRLAREALQRRPARGL